MSAPRETVNVLLVDDDAGLRTVLSREISRMGFKAEAAADAAAARELVRKKDFDVVILDLKMPGLRGDKYLKELKEESPSTEVIVLTGHADIDTAIECMKLGAHDFLTKPCPLSQLEVRIEKAAEKRQLVARCDSLAQPSGGPREIWGKSRAFQAVLKLVERIAPSDEPVLLLGESGTGKEMIAHEIVRRSARAAAPFLTVNCAALSESLLEAELFGHEKGAFTGAEARRLGVFQLADRGTIFLDEIGDMPPRMQAKLLRTLQSGEVRAVGGQANIYVNVRVISATNQDLPRMVSEGTFRADLFYRLNTLTVELPPLRARRDDIVELAEKFLAVQSNRQGRALRFSPEAREALLRHAWPGNVRELENVVKRASIMAAGPSISFDDLPDYIRQAKESPAEHAFDLASLTWGELERMQLTRMIAACAGNKREAARRLGISIKTLYNRLHAYGLDLDSLEPASRDGD